MARGYDVGGVLPLERVRHIQQAIEAGDLVRAAPLVDEAYRGFERMVRK